MRTFKVVRMNYAGVLATAVCLFTPLIYGQEAAKKAYDFRGKVTQVNNGSKRLTVANDPIEGWMGAMTMGYAVDKDDVLNQLKVGDRIMAKVYEGDLTLHEVKVVRDADVAQSPGQAKGGMRLDELEQMALANNPTVGQVQANLRAAVGTARQAGLYPNPTVGYYGDEIRGGYTRGGKQGGFVSQTIVLGGKLGAARRVAQLLRSEVDTTAEVQRLRILNSVRALFYDTLAAQRLVDVRQNLSKLLNDAVQTSYQLGNVGQADRPDILQAEVEQQQGVVNLRTAGQNLQAMWRMLAAVVGKPDLPLTNLEGDLDAIPDLNYQEWMNTTLRDSPEVKLARQRIERMEASLSQAKRFAIPDLQVTGILANNFTPLFESNTNRATGVQGGAQVGVQIPIFNRNQGNVQTARAEVEGAGYELTRVKLQIQRELAGLFRDYDSARATVQQYKTGMLPRAEQAYKLYQGNYQNMAAAYPQVLISQRTLFQLEADYVQALENAWQSAVAIRGFGLVDGLAEPMNPSMGSGQSMGRAPGSSPGQGSQQSRRSSVQ